jgi:death-on-curing protein
LIYLTAEQILFLHARIVEATGGSHGVRDVGLLESAVARPQASFGGEDLYPDLWLKTAALAESLIGNHPFLDGNKRTGVASAGLFLVRNGFRLTATNEELEALAVEVAEKQMSLEDLARWWEVHSEST